MKINTQMCLSRNPLKFNVHKDWEGFAGITYFDMNVASSREHSGIKRSPAERIHMRRYGKHYGLMVAGAGRRFAYKKGSFFVADAVIHGAIRYASEVFKCGEFIRNIFRRIFNVM